MQYLDVDTVISNTKHYIDLLENANDFDKMESMEVDAYRNRLFINRVCDKLNIFDWWDDYLSKSQLKDMLKFLNTARELGFTSTCQFKVGASGCVNGMWAENDKGFNIYKSFTPSYNYWSIQDPETGDYLPSGDDFDSIGTIKEITDLYNSVYKK